MEPPPMHFDASTTYRHIHCMANGNDDDMVCNNASV